MKRKGFTLVEMVMTVAVVFILAAIGAWRISSLKGEADKVSADKSLNVVNRMEQLADTEGVVLASSNALDRIQELQAKLAARGHSYYQFKPTNLVQQLDYDPGRGWMNKP